jgi:hypothetical protein
LKSADNSCAFVSASRGPLHHVAAQLSSGDFEMALDWSKKDIETQTALKYHELPTIAVTVAKVAIESGA